MPESSLIGLPSSMSASLEQIAEIHHPLVLLTRHSIREEVAGHGFASYALPLTPHGRQLAQAWGRHLLEYSGRRIHSCVSSPIQRCVDTASLMLAGQAELLGAPLSELPQIAEQALLVEPGSFVHDVQQAGPVFLQQGSLGFINGFLREEISGMKRPQHGVRDILQLLHGQAYADAASSSERGIHLAVSHDTILAALLAVMARQRAITWADWPAMMEGVWLWFDHADFMQATLYWLWRGVQYQQSVAQLIHLADSDPA